MWDSWIPFSSLDSVLTSLCHVINSVPATDHKVNAVQ